MPDPYKMWVAKTINEYVMSAVVQREPKQEAELAPCLQTVLPVSAERFLDNPSWVVPFTRSSGLVTDSDGALSPPAVMSRKFGIPAVAGTGVATQKIQTGQRVRLNGAAGLVEMLSQ